MTTSPAWTWRHGVIESDLPAGSRHVLLTLSCWANDRGENMFPSTETLAEACGVSEPTVIKYLGVAERAGWIEKRRHGYAGQKWARHEYRPRYPDGHPNAAANGASTGLVADRDKGAKAALVPCEETADDGAEALKSTGEGTKNGGAKALNDVKSNLPKNNSTNLPATPAGAGAAGAAPAGAEARDGPLRSEDHLNAQQVELWRRVGALIQREVHQQVWNGWLKDLSLVAVNPSFVIVAPTAFWRDKVASTYDPVLREALWQVFGVSDRPIEYLARKQWQGGP